MGIRNSSALQWPLVFGSLVGVYCVINLVLPRLTLNATVNTYVVQPLLWILVAVVAALLSGYTSVTRVKSKTTFIQLAFIIGFMQIMAYVVGGLFARFGKSPSALTPFGILSNLFFLSAVLVAMEFSRAWMINHMGKHRVFLAVVFTAILFTFLSHSLGQITSVKFNFDAIPKLSADWLPSLGEHLMASMLAMLAGPRAALGYRGMLTAFWWFCPVLPDLQWNFKVLIGLIVPVLGMVVVNGIYAEMMMRRQTRKQARQAAFPTGTIVTGIFAVGMVWFASGALPFQPVVIPTPSMVPVFYPSDIVIVAKTPANVVKLGDIIEFQNPKEQINVVHRVIKINGEGEQRTFITKGDNNNSADADPVVAKAVIGKVMFRVPKVGWLSLAIKKLMAG